MDITTYQLTPTDLLFFRDGRPMETGEGAGHGARWPLPTVFFDALHAALHRAFPEEQPWEFKHTGRKHRSGESFRFGQLRSIGPFPRIAEGQWMFPAPLDALPDESTSAVSVLGPIQRDQERASDLPKPLRYSLGSAALPTKDELPRWWNLAQYEAYLRGETLPLSDFDTKQGELFAAESTTGIGTDPETGTQDGVRIYSAQYLRLKPGISLGCAASMPTGAADGVKELFPSSEAIICGGQQRVCSVTETATQLHEVLPASQPAVGDRIKWTLLTPAIFARSRNEARQIDHPGGWLPSWVDPQSGKVMLPRDTVPRKEKETRKQWRARIQADGMDVRLVAACIGKPETITGWSDYLPEYRDPETGQTSRAGGKSTQLAVPAGSVYYFEGPDASLLQKLLAWDGRWPERIMTRSGSLAEKGMGLGITAPWKPFDS